ncbi:MAG: hypothetical protein J0I18_16265, partial [Actinobacteria bacterium]|nr:hypothetical protein [Actinomycetota bacterium]
PGVEGRGRRELAGEQRRHRREVAPGARRRRFALAVDGPGDDAADVGVDDGLAVAEGGGYTLP